MTWQADCLVVLCAAIFGAENAGRGALHDSHDVPVLVLVHEW
jgi:hypothetical protein